MMAHAMAHVTARDWTRQATRANISAISMEVAAAQVAKQAGANGSTGYAVRQAQGLSMPLEMLSLARKSQMEADALGAKAMAGAGLSPEALVRYLDREQRDAPGGMAATSAETPDRDTRLAALRGAIKSLPASEYAPPNPEFATFQQDVRRSAPYPPPPPLKRDNEK
jgi:predicted Zn-dependent protease